jgi:hypothetical protein
MPGVLRPACGKGVLTAADKWRNEGANDKGPRDGGRASGQIERRRRFAGRADVLCEAALPRSPRGRSRSSLDANARPGLGQNARSKVCRAPPAALAARCRGGGESSYARASMPPTAKTAPAQSTRGMPLSFTGVEQWTTGGVKGSRCCRRHQLHSAQRDRLQTPSGAERAHVLVIFWNQLGTRSNIRLAQV